MEALSADGLRVLPLCLLETPRRKLHLFRLLLEFLSGERAAWLAEKHHARKDDDDRQQCVGECHILIEPEFIHHQPLQDKGAGKEEQETNYKTDQASHHPEVTPLNVTSAAEAIVRAPRWPAPLAPAPSAPHLHRESRQM